MMPNFNEWNEWVPYALGVFAISYVMLLFQVERIEKRVDRVVELLLHIDEVEEGALAQRASDQWWREEARRTRFQWLRKLRDRLTGRSHLPAPAALED